MTRILITGSRTWEDPDVIAKALYDYIRETGSPKEETVIVHGACPKGADAMADQIAKDWEANIEAHPADWNTHGRSAGFKRNQHMVDLGADVLLAFIHNNSKGATHTVNLAEKAGIPVRIFREEKWGH